MQQRGGRFLTFLSASPVVTTSPPSQHHLQLAIHLDRAPLIHSAFIRLSSPPSLRLPSPATSDVPADNYLPSIGIGDQTRIAASLSTTPLPHTNHLPRPPAYVILLTMVLYSFYIFDRHSK